MRVNWSSWWTVHLVMFAWLLTSCHKAPPVGHAIPATPENSSAGISDAAGGAAGSVDTAARAAKRPSPPLKPKRR